MDLATAFGVGAGPVGDASLSRAEEFFETGTDAAEDGIGHLHKFNAGEKW